jgi:hypothetical protein
VPPTFPECKDLGGPFRSLDRHGHQLGATEAGHVRKDMGRVEPLAGDVEFQLERIRSAVGKTANWLVYPRPQQLTPLPCGGPARLDPSLEPRRSAVLISALATHGGRLGPFLAA